MQFSNCDAHVIGVVRGHRIDCSKYGMEDDMSVQVERHEFDGVGGRLAARLDRPAGKTEAYAIFAHCFTCSKDINAARRISGELARLGIAVLRFDFTGLGSSEGEFASTNFSSNLEDLRRAASYLRENFDAPQMLIGHSLGGAAVLAVAGDIPEVKAVVSIGAPADAAHVVHNFGAQLEEIKSSGEADVSLGGRTFSIQQQFVEDLEQSTVRKRVASMRKALLVLHSPVDQTVGIENAGDIFGAAKHPKSFVSLDGADHLLSDERDALFAARAIAAWVARYLDETPEIGDDIPEAQAVVRETGNGKFQNSVHVAHHRMLADEPRSFGGLDSGPSPYDFLSVALGACTSMTLRMYADRKKLDVGVITVAVDHAKVHAPDSETDAAGAGGAKIDQFERRLSFTSELDSETQAKMLEIADKCPVHKTMENGTTVVTTYAKDG